MSDSLDAPAPSRSERRLPQRSLVSQLRADTVLGAHNVRTKRQR